MEKRPEMSFALFIYGIKVKITSENKTRTTVMMLNPGNNFFLEFVEYKDKLKIKKTIFLPYIKNVRAKPENNKLKIRMRNEEDNIYITCHNHNKLLKLESRFNSLILHLQPFPYAIYTTNNLLYYALYELKIYQNKDKLFTEKDVQSIIDIIKIRKRKLKSNYMFNSTISSQNGMLTLQRTMSQKNALESNMEYCKYIKRKIMKLVEQGKSMDMKVIHQIFNILIEKEELFTVFEKYSLPKEERTLFLNSDDSISLLSINPQSLAPDKSNRMSFENLMSFIQEVQKEKVDGELIETLNNFFQNIRMESIFDVPEESEIKDISFAEFCCYMFSELNNIFDPDKRMTHHDLDHNLAKYCINTSHNTYLVGHQLYGKTTIEGIERAIEQGCRCVELDCWDGKNGEPIVTHGHTLTSECHFEKMIEKLSKIAFKNNKFPLIISLETHCSVEQREKMSGYLKKYFGKRLLILNEESIQKKFKLSQLMKTVILKSESNYPSNFKVVHKGEFVPREFDNDTLSSITALFKEKLKQEELSTPFGLISNNEGKFFNLLSKPEEYQKIKKLSKQNLIRLYPDAKRVGSSNYNPVECWFCGVQMVALNIQYRDEYTLINRVKFMENGGSSGGFLLKPNYIRNDTTLQISEYTLEVISGQIIYSSLLDENDFLEIYVVSPDREHKNEKYTFHFSSNFIHPVIIPKTNNPMKFVIIYPEMSFLVFKIRNSSENIKLVGAIPFHCVRPGIRVLDLYDRNLFLNCFSYLLVQITKR